jgi:hypothetical protein
VVELVELILMEVAVVQEVEVAILLQMVELELLVKDTMAEPLQ